MTIARRRGPDCISDLCLDRWSHGELSTTEAEAAATHIEACPRCSARRLELARDAQSFASEALPLDELVSRSDRGSSTASASTRTPRASRVLLSLTAGLAAAAALVLALRTGPDQAGPGVAGSIAPPASALMTRTKGGPRLGFYVRRGSRVFQGQTGETVHPGDALRFIVSTTEPLHVTVLSVDGSGVVSLYHPQGSASDAALSGEAQPLSSATQLDDTLGNEVLYGVFCAKPIAPGMLRAAVLANRDSPPFPDGCQYDRVVVVKEPP